VMFCKAKALLLRHARMLLLSLSPLALLPMSFAVAATAHAEAGPAFHIRGTGEEGKGEGAYEGSPLAIQEEGGEQVLTGEIVGTKIEIASKSVESQNAIYNNAKQGQIKTILRYHEPTLIKPALKECKVEIGTNNEFEAYGHLVWKWNGTAKQLEEKAPTEQKPGIVYTATEIEEGAKELPNGTLTEVHFKGTGCGVLAGAFPLKGVLSANLKPANLEEWSSELTFSFPGWSRVHFWNGKAFVGVEKAELTFAANPATLTGSIKLKAPEELAIFEQGPGAATRQFISSSGYNPNLFNFFSETNATHNFSFPKGFIICKEPLFTANATGASPTLRMIPQYAPSTCELTNGATPPETFVITEVKTRRCEYIQRGLTGTGTTHESTFTLQGCNMEFNQAGCITTLRPSPGNSKVTYTNFMVAPTMGVLYRVSGLHYTSTCANVTPSGSNGEYKGEVFNNRMTVSP
jgi:hypothetical protein